MDPPRHHFARNTLPRPPHLAPRVRDDRDTAPLWDDKKWWIKKTFDVEMAEELEALIDRWASP
jgi:hypothetical protein